ncbi:MAG: acylneuraminate cytidylyltransferase family protein [Candidatus Omnitrophota bacterium]
MYKNRKILCVIPARGGSKGLPGKNIKKLLGKPLIAYSIEHAARSKYIDRTIVSTDSKRIAFVAKGLGAEVPFLRPKHLATDKSSTVDALLHAIEWMENKEGFIFDILVLLHVTTPLRSVEDVDKSIELLFKKDTDNVFSVAQAHKNPYFNMVEVKKNGKVELIKKGKYTSRQSAPHVFDMNSSIYVWWKDVLKNKKSLFLSNTRIYLMPKERSVDIDDYFDFRVARMLLNNE